MNLWRQAIGNLCASTNGKDSAAVQRIDTKYSQTAMIGSPHAAAYRVGNSVMQWLARASDTDFADICRWNMARHQQHQLALDAITPELHDSASDTTAYLIAMGYFPRHAEQYMQRAINGVQRLYAWDLFDAHGKGANGQCALNGSTIHIADMFEANSPRATTRHKQTAFHEAMHAAGFVNNIGLFWGVSTLLARHGSRVSRALEEAAVSHSEQVGFSDRPLPDIMVPAYRDDTPLAGYRGERELIGMLLQYGTHGRIDAYEVTQAFFTKRLGSRVGRGRVEAGLQTATGLLTSYTDFYELMDNYEAYTINRPQDLATRLEQLNSEVRMKAGVLADIIEDEELRRLMAPKIGGTSELVA